MTDTIKNTLNNRLLQLCVLSLYLVHPKIKFHIFILNKVVTDSNLTLLLLRKKKKKKKKKKTHLGQFFKSVTSFET